MVVRLRAIGECGIDVGEAHVGPDAELAFALLLVLAMAGGHTVARRRLTDLLWPCTPDDRARHNLRQTLYKLRQLGVPVESESLHVWLPAEAVAPHPLLDADADGDGAAACELLRADRPFGEFLAGYAPTFSAPFAAWLDEQRSVVHARMRRAALTRLHDERRRGAWAAVETLARKVLQLDPLNEEATLALAEATVMTGSKRAAIAQLDAYLRDLGPSAGDIRLPAALLRRRIAERMPPSLSPPDGDPCFVGRTESMAFLHDQFRHARTVGARTVLVWGDAGIGKSRLTTEFARLAVMEGAQLARVGCQARDVDRPLSIFVDVVPHLLGLPGAIGCSPESMTYLRRLTSHDPTVLEPASEPREAELLFAYVRRAILDLVDAVAAESALLLVFEDVHWLDEQSWRVLRELIGWLERRRVLVVLTSRLPHATPTRPARAAAGVVEHRLGPLGPEEALALFDAATSGDAVPGEYREWCVQVADGNPLFVCELASHSRAGSRSHIPSSLEALVANNVRSLSVAAQYVLRSAAVLGRHATFERIAAMLGIRTMDVLAAVSETSRARLIGSSFGELSCRHQLIQAICLAEVPVDELAALHRLAAEALENDASSSLSMSIAWECTNHWTRANQPDRALHCAMRFASRLVEIGLPRDAAELLDRATPHDVTDGVGRECLIHRRDALVLSGEWEKLTDALALLDRTGQHSAGASIRELEQHAFLRLEAALRTGAGPSRVMEQAIGLSVNKNASSHHRLQCLALAVQCADNQFDASAAAAIYTFATALFPFVDDRSIADRVRAIYGNGFGDIGEALEATHRWLEWERKAGNALTLSRALRNAAIPFRTAGNTDAAFVVLRESYDIAASRRLASSAANTADVLATVNLNLGDVDQARWWHTEATNWAHLAEEAPLVSSIQIVGARIALAGGAAPHSPPTVPFDYAIASADAILRRKVDRLAILADIAMSVGECVAAADRLDELLKLHAVARRYHGHDYAASVIIRLMTTAQSVPDAKNAATAYIRDRRERGPLSHQLQMAVSTLAQPTLTC